MFWKTTTVYWHDWSVKAGNSENNQQAINGVFKFSSKHHSFWHKKLNISKIIPVVSTEIYKKISKKKNLCKPLTLWKSEQMNFISIFILHISRNNHLKVTDWSKMDDEAPVIYGLEFQVSWKLTYQNIFWILFHWTSVMTITMRYSFQKLALQISQKSALHHSKSG